MNWRELPMLRLLFPFAAGILLSIASAPPLDGGRPVLPLAGCLLLFLGLSWRRLPRSARWAPGLLLSFFLAGAGAWLAWLHDERNHPLHFTHHAGPEMTLAGTVRDLSYQPTGEGDERIKVDLRITAAGPAGETPRPAAGRLLAYLDKGGGSPERGDTVWLRSRVYAIPPPGNPHAFDYARYLHFRNVHYRVFVPADRWEWRAAGGPGSLHALAGRLQQRGLAILRRGIPAEREFAVAAALVLGYKEEISGEVRDAYAHTGAMHVLAVSGLHVGMIYLVLQSLLGLLPLRWRGWIFLRIFLLLAGVWSYVLVTGASPSVLRAGAMFSFFILGGLFHRQINPYNTLAASAFFLLCLNPFVIGEVGFQLSYLAVLGILYLQPRLYRLWYPGNRVADYLWQLLSVSVAAQIFTLPISLYYFHQFPVYFWLSGLVVVPAAMIILGGGLLLFCFHFLSPVSLAVGKALSSVLWLVNDLIFRLQQLPGGLLTDLPFSLEAVLLSYGVLILLVAAMETRRFGFLLAALTCLLLLAAGNAWAAWESRQQRLLAIYSHRGHTVVDLFAGRRAFSWQDTLLPPEELAFTNRDLRRVRRAASVRPLLLSDTLPEEAGICYLPGRLTSGRYRVAFIDGQARDYDLREFLPDLVVIRGDPRRSLRELTGGWRPSLLLWDASNRPRQIQRWQRECREAGWDCYDLPAEGAFLHSLR